MNDDVFGRSVEMTSDGTYDTYTVGGAIDYVFPTGTSQAAAYLSMAKQTQIARAQLALQAFILDRYPLETRWSLLALLNDANSAANILLVNRRAYIQQIFTWTKTVISYAATFMATVNAQTDPAAIAALKWDFTALAAADPAITPIAAVAIAN